MAVKPSIVFAHGIWADGSCFSKLIPPLRAEGYEVMSAQYGLDSNVEDVAATVRTFGRVSSPIVLVGHSYGGSVISQIEVADGRVWMKPSGIGCFCGDLPEEDQEVIWATHFAPAAELFLHNAPGVAWRSKPSWCIVANDDQTVNPELERFAAKRMGAATYDIDSSHVPMLSHPGFVLDVIRAAAAGI